MPSAIPTVRQAIEDRLRAATSLEDVSISRGSPDTPPTEAVVLGKATATRDYAALGVQPTPLNEQIRLEFVVGVIVIGGDYEAAEERAFVLMDAVDAELRSDLSLDGAWLYGRLTSIEQDYVPVDKGKACQIGFAIEGTARI